MNSFVFIGYCFFPFSNGGHTELFKEALDEATSSGVPWAVIMTRKRKEVMDKKEVGHVLRFRTTENSQRLAIIHIS